MANVLAKDRQLMVLNLLVEGTSLRSITRITGTHRRAVTNLLVRFGKACKEMLDEEMRGLTLKHIQADEIWTFVRKKQANLPVEEKNNPKIGDIYLWVALDQETKLVPTFALGKRTGDMARRFMVDLASRLVLPKPYQTDMHFDWQIPQLSSDAFAAYPEAVDLAFGPHVNYGQLVKNYRNADQQGRYSPPEMIDTDRRVVFGNVDPKSICTSHVERNNLTIRTFIKRFARLSLSFSKKFENLAAAVALHTAHYNFCRRHGSLRVTPAMAAGVTGTLWSLEDLYNRVLG